MKKLILTLLLSICFACFVFADELPKLTGNIGGYDIEMFIEPVDYFTGEFVGKYRYLNQKIFLSLEGNIYDNIFIIEEYCNDKNTGTFYLEKVDNTFIGKWYGNEKSFDVELKITEGDDSFLAVSTYKDMAQYCSDDITGTYKLTYYSLSRFLLPDETYPPQLMQNGGTATFEELDDGSLKFKIELTYGPNSHWAGAEGVAKKKGDIYVYLLQNYDDEICMIFFKFMDNRVSAKANDDFVCGFGVMAHMNDILYKVSDEIENPE